MFACFVSRTTAYVQITLTPKCSPVSAQEEPDVCREPRVSVRQNSGGAQEGGVATQGAGGKGAAGAAAALSAGAAVRGYYRAAQGAAQSTYIYTLV